MQRFGQWASCVNPVSKAVIERAVSIVMGALPEGSFADREQVALAVGNEVVRRVLLADLKRIAGELDADAVLVEGRRYVRHLPAKAELLWEHLVYLRNNKDRMRYATLRQRGMPVGSGVTESAANSVIGYRANRGGQRWLEAGLRGALTLRAVVLSDRYVRFWRHVSRHYTARVEVAA